MKFVCDSCQAQYLIADEKVGARGVKVKCKKCGNVIIIRPGNGAEADDPASMQEKSAMALSPVGESQAAAAPVRTASRAKMQAVGADMGVSTGGRTASRARMAAVPPPPPSEETTTPPTARADKAEDDSTVVNMQRPSADDLGLGKPAADANGDAFASMGAPAMENEPAAPALQEEKATAQGSVDEWAAKQQHSESSSPTLAAPPSEDVMAALEKHRARAAVAPAPPPPPAEPTGDGFLPPPPGANGNGASPELEQELAGAFDGLFGGAPGATPDDRKPTKVYTSDEADKLREGAGEKKNGEAKRKKDKAEKAEKVEKEAKGEKAPIEWYAAINDEQQGPLSLEQVENHWMKGEITAESLVWRTGMADWIPARDVKELKYLLDLVPQRKKPPVDVEPVVAPALSPSASVPPPSPSLGLAPAGDDASEEMWRPRGMTGVYQAASAAEASVAKAASAPLPALTQPREEEEPSWKPGAASALASLVDDELSALTSRKSGSGAKVKDGPAKAADAIPKPPPADDDSIEAPLSALLGTKGDAAFPGLTDDKPGKRNVTASVPFKPEPASRFSPMVIGMMAVGVLGLVVGGVGLAAALGAFEKKPAQVAQAPSETPPPAQPATQQPTAQQPAAQPAQPAQQPAN
ncbi:MAG: GYF domain-containing protein, partial [Myxococcota bacterium]